MTRIFTTLGFVGALACCGIGPSLAQSPCDGLGVQPVTLSPVMPLNFTPFVQQIGADCLAWQEFIYLNWQADPKRPGYPDASAPPSRFGTPGDTSATVWQSYLDAATVFRPTTAALTARWDAPRPAMLALSQISKVDGITVDIDSTTQASGGWLTDQRGGLTYYQILMNQDEFQFVTTNVFKGGNLTTASGQLACATQPGKSGNGGFNLPGGSGGQSVGASDTDCTGTAATYGQNMGAIEIKASWVALPANGALNYRYKTAIAQLTDPYGKTTQATVGLVGLHIIHKYPGAPQFVWATFEQIDNSPDDNNGATPTWPQLPPNKNQKPSPGYTFYNPSCVPSQDSVYQCQRNLQPSKPCKPPKPGCQPYSAPGQVTRIAPVDSVANSVTGYAWTLLPANSVFNYYRLIDVQWPNAPSPVPPQSKTPLSGGDIQPAELRAHRRQHGLGNLRAEEGLLYGLPPGGTDRESANSGANRREARSKQGRGAAARRRCGHCRPGTRRAICSGLFVHIPERNEALTVAG